MARVIIIGPGHPLRGGLATFNQRLANEFLAEGDDCSIISFSLQYPGFLFPGKTQYSDEAAPANLKIRSLINSVNPVNWIRVGRKLRKEKYDLVIVRFWLPFMGPALGTILRRIRKNKNTRIICIADNVIPHEKRFGDKPFTKYFLKSCDAFITMSEKVMIDLRLFQPNKPAALVQHPLYDNFGEIISAKEAREHLQLPLNEKIILFFGFIRNYKGLDLLLEAMADPRIRYAGIKLMIAGEFYEDEKPYREIISKLDLSSQLILRTEFISDSQVKYYLCAADAIIQPYRNATQSGVTPLAYHFEKPMVVTNVGGLPVLVPHEKVGIVTEPNPTSIAEGILRFYQLGADYFIPHLRSEKLQYSWTNLVKKIRELAQQVKK
jgi:glycosyltransferase involved in cell wall biosynthesis